jgi:hypothetical protein
MEKSASVSSVLRRHISSCMLIVLLAGLVCGRTSKAENQAPLQLSTRFGIKDRAPDFSDWRRNLPVPGSHQNRLHALAKLIFSIRQSTKPQAPSNRFGATLRCPRRCRHENTR